MTSDPLKDYLFLVEIPLTNTCKNTAFIRDVTWENKNLIIQTLVCSDYDMISILKSAKRIKISFLKNTGEEAFSENYKVKLINYHPLSVGHTSNGNLIYKFIYSY